jgi:hypothetical protein
MIFIILYNRIIINDYNAANLIHAINDDYVFS